MDAYRVEQGSLVDSTVKGIYETAAQSWNLRGLINTNLSGACNIVLMWTVLQKSVWQIHMQLMYNYNDVDIISHMQLFLFPEG